MRWFYFDGVFSLRLNKQENLDWIKFNPVRIPESQAFRKIIEFYLFNTPLREKNFYQAKTMADYGWEKSKLSNLKQRLLYDIQLKQRFYYFKTLDQVQQSIINNKILGNKHTYREIIIFLNNRKSIVESVLSLIRDAFAHRSFEVVPKMDENYYFMANVHNEKTKGRLILKESTLLRWIEIIKNG